MQFDEYLEHLRNIICICITNGDFNVDLLQIYKIVDCYKLVLTPNECTFLINTPTRINSFWKNSTDHEIHTENLPILNSQIEFIDIDGHCAIHVSYIFSLAKPVKKTWKLCHFSETLPKTPFFLKKAMSRNCCLCSRVIVLTMIWIL